jgi:nucleotide-binding universal stress UspA family protein
MSLFRRILVPHDFSPAATQALALAARLAGPRGKLLVLHVIPPLNPLSGLPPAEPVWAVLPTALLGTELSRLRALVARSVRGRDAPRTRCRVVIGDPALRILAARGVDVIVMATAGRTGLGHLLIGSVAEKVVRHARVPVLSFRPGGGRAGRASGARGRRAARPRGLSA